MDLISAINTFGSEVLGFQKFDLTTVLSLLLNGLQLTGIIFIVTLIGALPLGVLVALGRMSKVKPIAWIMRAYISFMRGTPLMLQLMALYYAPWFMFGIKLSTLSIGPVQWVLIACCVGFILNYAAYFAEIYRGGIQSIARGQYEAAEVLGYTRAQTFMKIVLPQVIKRIIPAMGNEVITLVKDTSLAFVLSMAEMFTVASQIASNERSMIPYVIAALIYWAFTIFAEFVISRVEKHYSYYHD